MSKRLTICLIKEDRMKWLLEILIATLIIIGCSKENPLSTIEEIINGQNSGSIPLKAFRLPGLDYEFHYLTIIEDSVTMLDPILGKELALMTLATLKRWTNEGYGNFDNEGKRGAYVNKIEACINQIEASAYQGARQKIINDLIPFAEANLTGPFLWTNGLLLESALASLIHPEEEIDVDESCLTVINATAYSIQHAIFQYIDGIGGITVPEPTLEDSLKALTQAMAMALSNSENRSILLNQLMQSEDEEHKILITDYLNAQTSNGYTVQKSLSISSGYREDYLAQFAQNHPDWTIYFPVFQHYENWVKNSGKSAPPVLYDPLLDEEYVTSLTSYLKDGAAISFEPQIIPTEPTLVVSPEPFDIPSQPDTIISPFTYSITVDSFHLYNDHEPWYKGAPEVYIRCYDAYSYSRYSDFNSGNWNVDIECTNYPRAGYPAQPKNIWYQTTKCTQIKIREDDWPDADDDIQIIDNPHLLPPPYRQWIGSTTGARIKVWGNNP